MLVVKHLSNNARTPIRSTPGSIGYDLFAAEDKVVPAHGRTLVPTDLQIKIPPGCYGRIAPRSSLALISFVDVGAGVIDPDYRGNVGVVLFNFSNEKYYVSTGDRIAQLILEQALTPEVREIGRDEELDETERGWNGFGSTNARM